ncbi:MAG: M3 family oligoendopeptidase [Candidatus Bipolaricaulota bacterium]|nr:M3 family oligoendopeptidase [Candidatus Bipolaricaulota bacterium]
MLDLSRLPKPYPRRFVPQNADMGDWAQIEPLLDELERRSPKNGQELEQLLLDFSELASAIYEEGAVRRIRMTCQTDNEEYKKAFLHFVENIEPKLKPRLHQFRVKYVQTAARKELPQARYLVFDRSTVNAVELFREENVPLETEATKLGQKYQTISGAQTVHFDGREQTLQQMAKYLEETDRTLRQSAWEKSEERRLQDRDALNALYDELIEIRQQIARNAGFANYRDYVFRARERFEYTPEDCFRYHQAVERHIVPLMRQLQRERQEKLGLKELRPWDLSVDVEGRPPLRPFGNAQQLIDGCQKIFSQLDSELAEQFRQMAELNLFDLESRKGKAPGGYQATLAERRLPFIFMNAVGRDGDLRTMLHESGHAFHTMATRQEHFWPYRHAPTEFAEVASMSMELLSKPYWTVFYTEDEAQRSSQEHLRGIVSLLAWVATIDAFQHWIYTHPRHTVAEREAYWLELRRRFGGIESWAGYEDAQKNFWQRQLHLYLYPFYYIEYGIAQLGALQLYARAKSDPREALTAYKRALALGGSRPLPELFKAAELKFDFGEETVKRAAELLRAELLMS